MKIKTVQLDDATRTVLMRSKIEGCNLTLPGQLERDLYVKVAKAIEAAGGKWNRKAGCHVFPHDVRETLALTEDTVAVVNVQQTYQAFYTPEAVANRMMLWAGIQPGHRILEPSAGDGALLRALPPVTKHVTAVEINPKLAAKLDMYCHEVIIDDFMKQSPDCFGTFDRVLMNPPFTGGQDIKHIEHAKTFVRPGGRLVAVCGAGPRQRERLKPGAAHWIDVPAGSFKESGTNVATVIMVWENSQSASRIAPKASINPIKPG